jgi:hypothetical protein
MENQKKKHFQGYKIKTRMEVILQIKNITDSNGTQLPTSIISRKKPLIILDSGFYTGSLSKAIKILKFISYVLWLSLGHIA